MNRQRQPFNQVFAVWGITLVPGRDTALLGLLRLRVVAAHGDPHLSSCSVQASSPETKAERDRRLAREAELVRLHSLLFDALQFTEIVRAN